MLSYHMSPMTFTIFKNRNKIWSDNHIFSSNKFMYFLVESVLPSKSGRNKFERLDQMI